MTIEEFYQYNCIDENFNESVYQKLHPETKNFYQPHCLENNIDDKHRLYFHHILYDKVNNNQNNNQNIKPNQNQKVLPNLSVIVSIKNRNDILKTSIHSWFCKKEIKEIIIVDYDSTEFDYDYFNSLDPRIKIISLKNRQYFNLSDAYNEAIKFCNYDYILKLDVDYLFNPYLELNDWIDIDWDTQFLTGHYSQSELDSNLGILKYLNGFICIKKNHIINVGGYNGNKFGYGYDDCDLYSRLEDQLGLSRRVIKVGRNFCPIIHLPHSDFYRTAHYEEKNLEVSLEKNKHCSNVNQLKTEGFSFSTNTITTEPIIYFVVSLPRTGTKSLCKMAEICGLKSQHVLQKTFKESIAEGYNFFAYTPFYIPEFLMGFLENNRNLNIKFIYSERDYISWKDSIKMFLKDWSPESFRKSYVDFVDNICWNYLNENYNSVINHFVYIKEIAKNFNIPILQYNLNQGWDPFCSFLDVPIPKDIKIPHLNKS